MYQHFKDSNSWDQIQVQSWPPQNGIWWILIVALFGKIAKTKCSIINVLETYKKYIFFSIHRNLTKIRIWLHECRFSIMTAKHETKCAVTDMQWHTHAVVVVCQDTTRVGAETRQCSHLRISGGKWKDLFIPVVWVTYSQILTSNGLTTLFYQVLKLETISHFTSRQSSSCPHMLARQWK